MIVKNEAHLIADTLVHLARRFKFDYWVIDDTGSTDGTQDIIRWFFGRLGISGELHETPWEDFGTNRSKALEHAYNKTDYVLVWDADDSIEGKFSLPATLTADGYSFIFGNASGFRYSRPQLFNNRKRWKYVGVLHEYPSAIDPVGPIVHCEGDYYFVSGRGGARSQDATKYLKDAAVLERGLEKEPTNHRYAFYCANSYRDALDYPKATAMYKRVLEMDGWAEEKYLACLRIYDMNPSEENLHYLVRGNKYSPNRAEVIMRLARHYTSTGQHAVAYSYYTLVQDYFENRYMSDIISRYLFVNREDFDFYMPYFVIIAALSIGRYDTAIRLYDIILKRAYSFPSMFYVNALFHNMYAIVDKMEPNLEFLARMLRYRALFPELTSLQPVTDMIKRHGSLLDSSTAAAEVQSLICSQLFIVNLERRADRRASMNAELGKQGITNYCFHAAVDGAQLVSTPELSRIFAGNDFQNRRGILGCAMSHYGLWQKVCAENRGFMIVLEDDITLCPDFQKRLEEAVTFMMSDSSNNIDVLFLGETLADVAGRAHVDGTGAPARPLNAATHIGGTFGYIITRKGAQRLLDIVVQQGMKRAVDAFMVHSTGISCWVAQPHLVHTEWLCAATPECDSDIQRDISTLDLEPPLALSKEKLWAFYSCRDSRGDDIICVGHLATKALLDLAAANPLCYAVNTGGWMKHRVTYPLIVEPSYSVAAGDGLYIRAPTACVFVDISSGASLSTQLARLAGAHARALKEKKALRIRLSDTMSGLHPLLNYYAPAICNSDDAAPSLELSGDAATTIFEYTEAIRSAVDIEALGDIEGISSEKCVIYIHHSSGADLQDISAQYYLHAALDMRHLYPATTFDIYSNNLAWCREQSWLRGSNFVEVSDPADILRSLLRYRRHIVSHSDMSWCGAWLADSGASTVVMSPGTATATARKMPYWSPVPV